MKPSSIYITPTRQPTGPYKMWWRFAAAFIVVFFVAAMAIIADTNSDYYESFIGEHYHAYYEAAVDGRFYTYYEAIVDEYFYTHYETTIDEHYYTYYAAATDEHYYTYHEYAADQNNANNDDYGYDDYREAEYAYGEPPIMPPETIMPLGGNLLAAITGEGQTVDFGPDSRIELGIRSSHLTGQTVYITEQFDAATAYEGVIKIRLENGLGLFDAQGRVPGSGPNWQFNIASIENVLLRDLVTGIRWILDDEIVQPLTGNSYQPLSGTLIYTFAQNTDMVTLAPVVHSDWAFSITGLPGKSHIDAITVTTFDDSGLTGADLSTMSDGEVLDLLATATPQNSTALEDYFMQGGPQVRFWLNPLGWHEVRERGDPWVRTLNVGSIFGNTIIQPVLVESVVFTLRFHVDAGVQGVRSIPGSLITDGNITPVPPSASQPMLSYNIVPDPSNANFVLLTITLTQPAIGHSTPLSAFQIYGEVATNAVQGVSHLAFPLVANSAVTTPFAGGVVDNRNVSFVVSSFLVPHDFINRLTVGTEATHLSSIPGDGAMEALGRFTLRNEFTEVLTNQAMRILFDCPNIGVSALRLPAGSAGIVNLHVWTTTGRLITDFSGVLPPTGGTGGVSPQPFAAVNFYGLLAPGEYIVEVYYELNGIVPVEQIWSTTFGRDSNFQYMGRVFDRTASRLPTRVIVGEFDPGVSDLRDDDRIVQNPVGMAENDPNRLRDTAAFAAWFPNNPDPRFVYVASVNNLNNVTLLGGAGFHPSFVQFTRGGVVIQSPSAVKGHYVYLRAPDGQLDIYTNSISVTWGGSTYSVAAGTLDITALPPGNTGGDRVYRLALPDVIIGFWDEDLAEYPPLRVDFNIRALPQTPIRSIPLREIVTIIPMNPALRADAITVGNASIQPVCFTDHRVGPATDLAGPPIAHSLTVQPAMDLVLWAEVQRLDGSTLIGTSGQMYNWESGTEVVNLAPGNNIQYRIHYLNNAGAEGDFIALIPIPKAGELFIASAAPYLQREAFGFSLNLLSEVIVPPGFTVFYSTSYTLDINYSGFVPWSAVSGNTENIRMVRIEGNSLTDDAEGHVALSLGVATGIDGNANVAYRGQLNRYASWIWRSVGGTAVSAPSTPVAMRMWNYVVFHYNYIGSDGIFLEVPVVHGGTVSAPTLVPTRPSFVFYRWTTDAAGLHPYDFDTAVTEPNLNLFAQWSRTEIEFFKTGERLYEAPPVIEVREGAVFRLYREVYDDDLGGYVWEEVMIDVNGTFVYYDVTSDSDGRVVFTLSARNGAYKIRETTPPPRDYMRPPGYWIITMVDGDLAYTVIGGENVYIVPSDPNNDRIPPFVWLDRNADAEDEDETDYAWFVGNFIPTVDFPFHKATYHIYNEQYWDIPGWLDSVLLYGAEFALFRYSGMGTPGYGTSDLAFLVTQERINSGYWQYVDSGPHLNNPTNVVPLVLQMIPGRYYHLVETAAPAGHQPPWGQWRIMAFTREINIDGEMVTEVGFSITTQGAPFTPSFMNPTHTSPVGGEEITIGEGAYARTYTVFFGGLNYLGNFPIVVLPMAGASGGYRYTMAGLLMILLALVVGLLRCIRNDGI